MSEEEKETIRFLRVFSRTEIDYCNLEKADVLDILNVITKLNKEIDELKERQDYARLEKEQLLEDSISKDKIKEIVNRYATKEIEYGIDFYREIKELLEE